MTDDDVIALVEDAFGSLRGPKHPLDNPDHCQECRDHYDLMQSRDRVSLRDEDLNSLYSPFGFLNAETFWYFFPSFVRLALRANQLSSFDDTLFEQLACKPSDKHVPKGIKFSHLLTEAQFDAVIVYLKHYRDTRYPMEQSTGKGYRRPLDRAVRDWEEMRDQSVQRGAR